MFVSGKIFPWQFNVCEVSVCVALPFLTNFKLAWKHLTLGCCVIWLNVLAESQLLTCLHLTQFPSPQLTLTLQFLAFWPTYIIIMCRLNNWLSAKWPSAGSAITNGRKPRSCLGRVFNSKLGYIVHRATSVCTQPLLKLKTQPKARPVS